MNTDAWACLSDSTATKPHNTLGVGKASKSETFLFLGYKGARDDRVTIFLSSKCSALVLTKHPA